MSTTQLLESNSSINVLEVSYSDGNTLMLPVAESAQLKPYQEQALFAFLENFWPSFKKLQYTLAIQHGEITMQFSKIAVLK